MNNLEDEFQEFFQEVLEIFEGEEINMKVARQIYYGAHVEGYETGQLLERKRVIGILAKGNKYGRLPLDFYRELKNKIEGR